MRRCLVLACVFTTYATSVPAQTSSAALAAREWRQQHERAVIDEFFLLLSLPNISSDKANIQRNAEFIAVMMQKRGVPRKAGEHSRYLPSGVRRDQDARCDARSFTHTTMDSRWIQRNGPRLRFSQPCALE
jgi:hypothetical protein